MIKLNQINGFYSVVLLGSFNPLIFHPFWLLQKKLISEADVTDKEIIVNDQISNYKVGDWLQMTVTRERLEFKTFKPERVVLMRDLIVGTLNALPEIPIFAVGINRDAVYSLGDERSYYEFGANLAPLHIWEPSFHNPRLRIIAIEDSGSEDFEDKRRLIQIKPANTNEVNYCIQANINNHYDLKNVGQNVVKTIELLDKYLNSDFDTFQTIMDTLVEKINKNEKD